MSDKDLPGCTICKEPTPHELNKKPWCGKTACYVEIATAKAADKARKTDDQEV